MNNIQKYAALFLILCLVLTLSGCRIRTTGGTPPAESSLPDSTSGTSAEDHPGDAETEKKSAEDGKEDPAEAETAGGRTRENPEAARKEYDENAPAEIVPGTNRLIHGEGEGEGAPLLSEEAQQAVSRLNSQAEETASQTVAAEEADRMGVDEDAEEADSAMTYFTVLLEDRLGSLYECQRTNIYWETEQDYVTVFKTSTEHGLILEAGAYDVSARLLEENLKVNDGWVVRKNPGVIVKIVDSGVLGNGTASTDAARTVYQRLTAREDWKGIDAVKNGRVLLLSQELLEAPYLQTAAKVMIAKTAYESLFADVDPEKALRMLTEEAAGTVPEGIWFYTGGET